jgi:hypothetical protein
MWTGMMARVFGPIAAAKCSGRALKVRRSTSMKTGFSPA